MYTLTYIIQSVCTLHNVLYCISFIVLMLYNTSFNPQNLRNTVKKIAKISITQILIIELVCQNKRILLFF